MDSPSLRNSHQRGFDLKLRRTDQALHDTTKSFVESLSKDIRISQHADVLFACKKLDTEKSYWLKPLQGQARPGYLVFLPKQPVIWIDEQFKSSYRIPIRVSFQIYEKKSIFIASLDRTDGILRLEDCWLMSGEFLRQKPFSERWDKVITFFDTKHKPDPVLQQGLSIEPAIYECLNAVKGWEPLPPMAFLQGETVPRRLRVYFKEQQPQQHHVPIAKKTPVTHDKPLFVDDAPECQVKEESTNDGVARAVPHEEYPDTYNLFVKGVKKGYAAVQDLELSRALRSHAAKAKAEKKEMFVEISWSEEFDMYEIKSIVN